jgi:hypothetical protein
MNTELTRVAFVILLILPTFGCVSQKKWAYEKFDVATIGLIIRQHEDALPLFSDPDHIMDGTTYNTGLAVCTKDGQSLNFYDVSVFGNELCGQQVFKSFEGVQARCVSLTRIERIGRPVKGVAIGYYPGTTAPVRCR